MGSDRSEKRGVSLGIEKYGSDGSLPKNSGSVLWDPWPPVLLIPPLH